MSDEIGTEIKVQIGLEGHHCNLWPLCRILLNDDVVFDGEVQGDQSLEFNMVLRRHNSIMITHHGKRFGEGRIYDTKIVNGEITQDRFFRLYKLRILGLDMSGLWHLGKMIEGVESVPLAQYSDAVYFNKNVVYGFDFSAPFYDWMIDTKRQGYKAIGPSWKMSSLGAKTDGYSHSVEELNEILERIRSEIEEQ